MPLSTYAATHADTVAAIAAMSRHDVTKIECCYRIKNFGRAGETLEVDSHSIRWFGRKYGGVALLSTPGLRRRLVVALNGRLCSESGALICSAVVEDYLK
jgi:hypothetical protein